MHEEEVARARGLSLIILGLTTTATAFVPILPGTTPRKILFVSALTLLGITSIWVRLRTLREGGYTANVFRVFGYVAATASLEIEHYLGVFSPTPLVVTLGVSFFGMGIDRRHAVYIVTYAVAGYFVLAALTAFGVVEDAGVISSADISVYSKVFFVVMVPLVLLTSLWFARVSRRSMATAMHRSANAMRLAGEREAQLAEMALNLEQALKAGAEHGGRFTGHRAGRWELGEIVGRGAMGEVYAATDPGSGERAAIKLLRIEALANPQHLERFLREGELAGHLDVRNVVRVYDVGKMNDQIPYIAMELLEGRDLAAHLRKNGSLSPEKVAGLITEVAAGLDVAHDAGIVHRDLKPQNLFLHHSPEASSGIWKILDFGVSKVAGSEGTLTQAAVIGTPGYMSPEQARGEHVDRRSDVFSLGAVSYRALSGRPPFSGADLPQILFDIVYRMPLRPSSLVDRLPSDVDAVLAIALAKKPEHRFNTAGDFAQSLRHALHRRLDPAFRKRAAALTDEMPWRST